LLLLFILDKINRLIHPSLAFARMCADPCTIHESSSDDALDVLLANNKGGDDSDASKLNESSSSDSSSEASHEEILLSLAKNNISSNDKNALPKPVFDAYQSPPMVTQKTILMVGFAIYLAAQVWPPLILVVTYMASIFIPYAYRINDDASTRRKLIHQFETEDQVAAVVRQLPEDVSFEESYWPTDR
jgi:hypothetical protein